MAFDIEMLQGIYNDLLAKKKVAVDNALLRLDDEVNGRLELLRANLVELVTKELTEEASKPFDHDIALFEKALIVEQKSEEPASVADQPIVE